MQLFPVCYYRSLRRQSFSYATWFTVLFLNIFWNKCLMIWPNASARVGFLFWKCRKGSYNQFYFCMAVWWFNGWNDLNLKKIIFWSYFLAPFKKKSKVLCFGMHGHFLAWKHREVQWKEMITLPLFGTVWWFNWWHDLRKNNYFTEVVFLHRLKKFILGRQSFVSTRQLFVLKRREVQWKGMIILLLFGTFGWYNWLNDLLLKKEYFIHIFILRCLVRVLF